MAAFPLMQQLYGVLDTHVVPASASWALDRVKLHPDALEAFLRLRADANGAGIDLRIASGFRDFQRQITIWNDKALGRRAVLDHSERPIDVLSFPESERIFAMLRWSALPGTSRHHWGTDMDVFDQAGMASDYRIRLSVDETCGNGPFRRLHLWLDEQIAANRAHGFFRPYIGSGCAVAAEPWHLSYAPLAAECQQIFDPVGLSSLWRGAGMELRDSVEEVRAEILQRFFWVPSRLYPVAWRKLVADSFFASAHRDAEGLA